jgi:hypothetical protein
MQGRKDCCKEKGLTGVLYHVTNGKTGLIQERKWKKERDDKHWVTRVIKYKRKAGHPYMEFLCKIVREVVGREAFHDRKELRKPFLDRIHESDEWFGMLLLEEHYDNWWEEATTGKKAKRKDGPYSKKVPGFKIQDNWNVYGIQRMEVLILEVRADREANEEQFQSGTHWENNGFKKYFDEYIKEHRSDGKFKKQNEEYVPMDWSGERKENELEKARKAQEDLPWTKMEESAVDENWENVKSVEEMHGGTVTGTAIV